MSRILAIHRYYWPDAPPYASLLRAIARAWTSRGHDVTILTGQPSYKADARLDPAPAVETVDGSTVRRVAMKPDRSARWRRLFNVLWFPLTVGVRVGFGPRQDLVMCSTVPPVLLGWVVSTVCRVRRMAFVYHCMDLHPEIGRLSGDFANRVLYAGLARLELTTCRRAAAVVVLSEDMRRSVLERDPRLAPKIAVITNFELPDFAGDRDGDVPFSLPRTDRVRVVFAGNVGRFQGLEAVVEAVLSMPGDEVELVCMGEGHAKAALRRLVDAAPPERADRIIFLPHSSQSDVRELLGTADLGLVSLSPGVIRYAYPSKTAVYLASGLPLLVAVEPDSELARLVESRKVGLVLPVGDVGGVREVLSRVVEHRHELKDMAERATWLWREEFSAGRILGQWVDLVRSLRTRPVELDRESA